MKTCWCIINHIYARFSDIYIIKHRIVLYHTAFQHIHNNKISNQLQGVKGGFSIKTSNSTLCIATHIARVHEIK